MLPRVKIDDKLMLHALLNIAVPKYGIPQHDAVWDLLTSTPRCANGTRRATARRDVWGGARWDGEGARQNPMPSAFGTSTGARARRRNNTF